MSHSSPHYIHSTNHCPLTHLLTYSHNHLFLQPLSHSTTHTDSTVHSNSCDSSTHWATCIPTHIISHSLNHLYTHPPIYSALPELLVHPPTHILSHSHNHLYTHPPIYSATHSTTCTPTHPYTQPLTQPLVHPPTHILSHSHNHLYTHPPIYSALPEPLVHPPIHILLYAVICMLQTIKDSNTRARYMLLVIIDLFMLLCTVTFSIPKVHSPYKTQSIQYCLCMQWLAGTNQPVITYLGMCFCIMDV